MSTRLVSQLTAAWLAAAALTAAGAAAAAEPLHVGATFITSGTDPAKGSNGWALVSHGVGENLLRSMLMESWFQNLPRRPSAPVT